MQRPWRASLAALLLAGGALATAMVPGPAYTADHRDAPDIQEDPAADLLDVFAFKNPKADTVVLAATVHPFLVAGTLGVPFSPEALYQFKIDNTGDFKEDVVIQVVFKQSPVVPFGTLTGPAPAQEYLVIGPGRPTRESIGTRSLILNPRRNRNFAGQANGTVANGPDGLRAFVGQRDDPFFVDLIWVLGIINGRPINRDPGLDTIAGLNCSVIAVEVPAALLRGSTGNTIRMWSTVSRAKKQVRKPVPNSGDLPTQIPFFSGDTISGPYIQVDRTAIPAINTVLIPTPLKDAFNRAAPTQDRPRFRSAAITRVSQILGGNTKQATAFVDFVLPDVLTLDMTSTAGFPNGRRPEDDVIDTALQVLTGNQAVSDGVQSNDRAFETSFPFFGLPHPPSNPVPGRN